MKIRNLSSLLVLALFVLTGCTGRLTGGGTFSGKDLTDPDVPHDVSAKINFQNVAGAICHPDLDEDGALTTNIPDTIRGSFTYRETSPNDRSFTCEAEPIEELHDILIDNNFFGSGQFVEFEGQGRVTQYTGDWGPLPPKYCAYLVLEGQVPGQTPQKGSTRVVLGLFDLDVDQVPHVLHVLYAVDGLLTAGNLQYHLANVQGICSSNADN